MRTRYINTPIWIKCYQHLSKDSNDTHESTFGLLKWFLKRSKLNKNVYIWTKFNLSWSRNLGADIYGQMGMMKLIAALHNVLRNSYVKNIYTIWSNYYNHISMIQHASWLHSVGEQQHKTKPTRNEGCTSSKPEVEVLGPARCGSLPVVMWVSLELHC